MIRVVAFTGGENVPSARFRVRQFIEPLLAHNVTVDESRTHTTSFPPRDQAERLVWLARRIVELAPVVARSRRADVVLLQREMISSFRTLEGLTGRPRVLDVDDSIHLQRGGRAAAAIARGCDRVIVGNRWLEQVYRQWCDDVVVLPTGIDALRYRPLEKVKGTGEDAPTIGWIGTSANFVHLERISSALATVLADFPQARLRIVAERSPQLSGIPSDRIDFVPWSQADEIRAIQSFDIGIMPLSPDGWAFEWALGKCSFKMLQYMSCGIPVIVSPIGMNAQVLEEGPIGFGPASQEAWVDALRRTLADAHLRRALGAAGRDVVLRRYDVAVLTPQLAQHLRF